jgi:siroheme synthase
MDWQALVAAFPVLVIYMGTRNLPNIAKNLVDAGMKATTPVAVLHAVSLPNEKQDYGTLADVISGALVGVSPAIVVIGDVVNKRREWRSIHRSPPGESLLRKRNSPSGAEARRSAEK